ncbi:MAG: hypothetical protein COT74_01235 [Bdellovibrionales bacterium CG10_big_fil_rev_8_21_14_0_10_45_34]|nr:MAG: hypothetical protein COT74_01235 [Bdellovibrionales bacterium CG10_big_fil_rev_8_21_14_0_10_45_34]
MVKTCFDFVRPSFYLLFPLLFLCASISPSGSDQFVIWNVGQGQWTTYVTLNECFHTDFGGEKFNLRAVSQLCAKKKNLFFPTHLDHDHVGFHAKLSRAFSSHCVFLHEHIIAKTGDTKKKIFHANQCEYKPQYIQILLPNIKKASQQRRVTNRNPTSASVVIKNKIWISGDAPKKQERLWLKHLNKQIDIWVLGHHGSQTSTDSSVLVHLKNLKTIVASQRYLKHRHPSVAALKTLKVRGHLPLLTEHWGNVIFQF